MSLCKPLTVSPAWIEANRCNVQEYPGPRAARCKVQSPMNALCDGGRSPLYRDLRQALFDAPPGAMDKAVRTPITPSSMENTGGCHDVHENTGT